MQPSATQEGRDKADRTAVRPFHKLDRGGHFAAWEQPQLFCEEVRTGLRSLRRVS